MHYFNNIFTPFGIIILLFALFFSNPDKTTTTVTISVLIIQFITNFYFSKNIYRYIKYMSKIRVGIVIFNIITTSVIFYFITAYWAPSWLLYTMPPAFAATFMKKKPTILISAFSSISMLFIYWLRSYILELNLSTALWAMALCHALFIIVFALLINHMSELIIKMRETAR